MPSPQRHQLNIRLPDDMKAEFDRLTAAASARAGVPLSATQVMHLAIAALAKEFPPDEMPSKKPKGK